MQAGQHTLSTLGTGSSTLIFGFVKFNIVERDCQQLRELNRRLGRWWRIGRIGQVRLPVRRFVQVVRPVAWVEQPVVEAALWWVRGDVRIERVWQAGS